MCVCVCVCVHACAHTQEQRHLIYVEHVHYFVTLYLQDFALHKGKSEYEDLIQSNNKPSTLTDRGHQTPAAFIIMASGLDEVN